MLNTLHKGQRNVNVRKINVNAEENKGRDVMVRHVSRKWKGRSTWNWNEDFAREWSKIYLTGNRERTLK
jgi:hypothetical protein